MHLKSKVIFLFALATANAGLIHLSPKILEGPSSRTTLVGPDGSIISAFAPGGKILLDDNQGPLLQGAPEVVAVAGAAQPLPATESSVVEEVPTVTEDKIDIEVISVEPVTTPTVILKSASEKLVEGDHVNETTTEAITTSTTTKLETETKTTSDKNVPPPSPKGHAPIEVKHVGSPAVLSFIPDSPLFTHQYTGFEGHFIPDHFEHAFDDGSYNQAIFDW